MPVQRSPLGNRRKSKWDSSLRRIPPGVQVPYPPRDGDLRVIANGLFGPPLGRRAEAIFYRFFSDGSAVPTRQAAQRSSAYLKVQLFYGIASIDRFSPRACREHRKRRRAKSQPIRDLMMHQREPGIVNALVRGRALNLARVV
jgi:hypothetical protein